MHWPSVVLITDTVPSTSQSFGLTSHGCLVHAESKFYLKHISADWEEYDHLVGSLPQASVRPVLDVLEDQDQERLFTALKEKLLSSHKMTNFKRIEKLMRMEPLGGRKPTELRAETLPQGTGQKYVFPLFVPPAPSQKADACYWTKMTSCRCTSLQQS
jgi:hypothetical protein